MNEENLTEIYIKDQDEFYFYLLLNFEILYESENFKSVSNKRIFLHFNYALTNSLFLICKKHFELYLDRVTEQFNLKLKKDSNIFQNSKFVNLKYIKLSNIISFDWSQVNEVSLSEIDHILIFFENRLDKKEFKNLKKDLKICFYDKIAQLHEVFKEMIKSNIELNPDLAYELFSPNDKKLIQKLFGIKELSHSNFLRNRNRV